MTGAALHFLVGVAIVGGLLWGASRIARWASAGMSRTGRDGTLRIVGRRQVVKGAVIVRVSVEDRDLLLGASQKGVELLCELPKTQAPVAAAAAPEMGFGPDGQPIKPSFAEALARSVSLRRRRY